MLKTIPSKTRTSEEKSAIQPKNETLNAILNFSRSLEVKKIKSKLVLFNLN